MKNISQTIKNETQILKLIKDDVNLSTGEYPHSTEILNVLLELLFHKENSLCFIIEEIMMNKGQHVRKYF